VLAVRRWQPVGAYIRKRARRSIRQGVGRDKRAEGIGGLKEMAERDNWAGQHNSAPKRNWKAERSWAAADSSRVGKAERVGRAYSSRAAAQQHWVTKQAKPLVCQQYATAPYAY
jgi:hypothetical protein